MLITCFSEQNNLTLEFSAFVHCRKKVPLIQSLMCFTRLGCDGETELPAPREGEQWTPAGSRSLEGAIPHHKQQRSRCQTLDGRLHRGKPAGLLLTQREELNANV